MNATATPQQPDLEQRVVLLEVWAQTIDATFGEQPAVGAAVADHVAGPVSTPTAFAPPFPGGELVVEPAPEPFWPSPAARSASTPSPGLAPKPAAAPAPTRAQAPAFDMERFLGGQVLAWVGAVAVLAGLVLLFALGISNGWIGPTGRTVIGAAVAALLTGFGVRLHERHGRTEAARAAVGAGVAGLFLAVTTASRVYHLIPASVGLLLAGAIAIGAAWLALRWTSRTVAAVGIIGALLAPVLTGAPGGLLTLAFLLIASGGAVAVLLRERWGWLAGAVFVIPAFQWLAWLFDAPPVGEILLVLCSFGAINVVAAVGLDVRIRARGLEATGAFLLASNALLLGLAGWLALRDTAPAHADLVGVAWLAGLALAHGVIGGEGRRRGRVSTELHLLALVLAMVLADSAFALSDVAVPLKAAGWAFGAIGFALLSRRERPATETALVGFGIGGHVALSTFASLAHLNAGDLFGAGAGQDAALSLMALASSCLIAGRLTPDTNPTWRRMLDAVGLSAAAVLAAVVFDGVALTAVWAGAAVALAQLGARSDDADARNAGYAHLFAAAVWCVLDQAPIHGLVDGDIGLGAAALGLGAVTIAAARLAWLADEGSQERLGLITVAAIVPLYLASLAVIGLVPESAPSSGVGYVSHQQGQFALSGLWALTGVAALLIGLRRDIGDLRRGALALLALTIGKVFFYDLATLTSVWRISSFMALGLLLLGAAFAYQRLRPGVAQERDTV